MKTMITNKYVPLRRCLGCGEQKEKKDLIRIVKFENKVSIDLTGKKQGRGAYICKKEECFNKVIKSKKLGKALGVEIDKDFYEAIANFNLWG